MAIYPQTETDRRVPLANLKRVVTEEAEKLKVDASMLFA